MKMSSVFRSGVAPASWLPAQKNSRIWQVVASPTTSNLNGVCYGNGTWLAFGAGEIHRSADGIAWQPIGNVTGFPPAASVPRFLKGRFLVKGTPWKQSVDGQIWTEFASPPGFKLNDVTCAHGKWVGVGSPGLFAFAEEPGIWTRDRSALTSSSVDFVVHMGGRFHAFSFQSVGMDAFSSVDGITWTIQPRATQIWFDRLESGEIERADGSVESVVVGTANGEFYHIGRAAGDHLTWETGKRDGVFGKLIYRLSADAMRQGLSRREWVNLGYCCRNQRGAQVYSLGTSGETPVTEDAGSLNDILAVAAGPDAMIAVGRGGLIRRYPTGLSAPAPDLNVALRPPWN